MAPKLLYIFCVAIFAKILDTFLVPRLSCCFVQFKVYFSNPLTYENRKISLPLSVLQAQKKIPFRVEPPCTAHNKAYPQGALSWLLGSCPRILVRHPTPREYVRKSEVVKFLHASTTTTTTTITNVAKL